MPDVVRFQTGDRPWSENVLMQYVETEWRRRLKLIRGKLRIVGPDRDPGPYRERDDAIHRAAQEITSSDTGTVLRLENERDKGVRARVVDAQNPFGPVYHTTGPCRDDYPNMVIRHNAGGQIVKMQEPALEAYAEAERLNGRPIRITGEGWRSCAIQSALYRSDPGRFANPAYSRHCRGLAIDVFNTPDNLTAKAKTALESVGFCFGVNGEPWHAAYTECG
jgi:hypothetical protein